MTTFISAYFKRILGLCVLPSSILHNLGPFGCRENSRNFDLHNHKIDHFRLFSFVLSATKRIAKKIDNDQNMNKQCSMRALSRALTLTSHTFCSTTSSSSSTSTFSLKNVTKSNFKSSLEDLRRHVRASDFVAVDLEMTGVASAPWRESFKFDRFDIRYLKAKDSAEKFAVVQFGVCPFRWDSVKQSFVARPHNFYIFPRQDLLVDSPSCEFLCQTTSIDFLAKYRFDFNACINEGISYLSRGQEDEALRRLDLAYEDESSESWSMKEVRDLPLVSMADILFSERVKNSFREWPDGLLRERSQFQDSFNDSKQQFHTIFFKMRPALTLNGFTSCMIIRL